MGVDRWFYWDSTYYDNYQDNTGQTNVFQKAQTYGKLEGFDDVLYETGWNYLNVWEAARVELADIIESASPYY